MSFVFLGNFQLIQAFNYAPSVTFASSQNFRSTRFAPFSMKTVDELEVDTSKTIEEPILDPEAVLPEVRSGMEKTVSSLQKYLSSIHIGRASPDLLSRTTVRAYGVPTLISHLGTISVVGMQQLTVEPYDSSLIKNIARAIIDSDLGLSPTYDGNMVFVDVPPMNEEIRISMGKKCKKASEEGKVSIRNIRRNGMESIKKMEKLGVLSQDEEKRIEAQINKITEEFTGKVGDLIQRKMKEVMTV